MALTGGMRLIFENGRVEETQYSLYEMIYAIQHMRVAGQPEPPRPVLAEYQLQGRDY